MTDPRHILVVDDQQDILELTSTVLAGAGYRVTTASSGAECLRALVRHPVDLVLLDINMPEMDGWETLRLIRADDAMRDVPVVMFSVKGEMRDKVHGMQEGALDYITKPFEVDTLLLRIRRIFESVGCSGPAPPAPGPVP